MGKKANLESKSKEIIKELESIIKQVLPDVDRINAKTVGVQIKNKKIVGLGLNECGLTSFPEPIFTLKDLESLSLAQNPIKKISEKIIRLQNLQKLYLKGTGIEDILAIAPLIYSQLNEKEFKEIKNHVVPKIRKEIFPEIQHFNPYEMDFADYIPSFGKEKHPFVMFHNISTNNRIPPPNIVKILFLYILELPNYGEEDKVNWHTFFIYKDCYYKIRDYMFGDINTWTLAGLMKEEDTHKAVEGLPFLKVNPESDCVQAGKEVWEKMCDASELIIQEFDDMVLKRMSEMIVL